MRRVFRTYCERTEQRMGGKPAQSAREPAPLNKRRGDAHRNCPKRTTPRPDFTPRKYRGGTTEYLLGKHHEERGEGGRKRCFTRPSNADSLHVKGRKTRAITDRGVGDTGKKNRRKNRFLIHPLLEAANTKGGRMEVVCRLMHGIRNPGKT